MLYCPELQDKEIPQICLEIILKNSGVFGNSLGGWGVENLLSIRAENLLSNRVENLRVIFWES